MEIIQWIFKQCYKSVHQNEILEWFLYNSITCEKQFTTTGFDAFIQAKNCTIIESYIGQWFGTITWKFRINNF